MLSSLVRLVPAPGIRSLPSCDWFWRRVYALFPRAIGSGAGYMLSSLMRLVIQLPYGCVVSCEWRRR
eukprot:1182020-Prorocentrum_minimum.AAC.2